MTHRHVESPTIAERDTHFPTDFPVSWGYRPDPFLRHFDAKAARYAWGAIAFLIFATVLFLRFYDGMGK
jgi:hypothetical protein